MVGNAARRPEPEQTVGERRRIAVEQDRIRRNTSAIGKDDTTCSLALGFDPRDFGIIGETGAALRGEPFQGHGKLMHAAPDGPDAGGFGTPDQREHCGGLPGRAADIGRIAPEKLTKARVAEPRGQPSCQRRAGQEIGQKISPLLQRVSQNACQIRAGGLHDRLLERIKQTPGLQSEGLKPDSLVLISKGRNCRPAPVHVRKEIEA